MIVYIVATDVFGTEEFPQYNIADLNSGIAFIVLFTRGKPLQWKEINTHTHTHTHTLTRYQQHSNSVVRKNRNLLINNKLTINY